MRILVVSAHFPPNFVSGGTLAPQRQARGLRRRGHEVSVYAGWLGQDRPPLDAWTEVDDTGLAVRWVVTTPWAEWGDRRNHDNPAVAADFARHLADVRPELVHFHSLQSLGAGLIGVAADAGARVVVTVHDFWWWCARQFFVDRRFQPCPPVVSCGVCPCQVDRAWLEERNTALGHELGRAHAVLAVSASQADVLAANGVEPARLRVDENGVPAAERAVPGRDQPVGDGRGGDLRLVYAGGPHRMKGVHVVLDAARRLAHRPGWRLTAYGARRFVEDEGLDLSGLPVAVAPAFDTVAVDDVFARADVLVVPSVMLESHSLLTREALTRGVPVVCTDTLGPEEVVEHGRNGLVVPAADAAALAAALARLLDEPDLLDRLRAGCHSVPVRSVEDQVAGLEVLYRELVERRRPAPRDDELAPPTRRRPVGTVLFLAGIEGAPLRYRARLPAEALALLGVRSEVRHYRDPELPALAARADAVVAYRVPATSQVLELLATVKRRGVPVFFDVDDLIFDPALEAEIPALSVLAPAEAALWLEGVHRYRTTMEACDAFIGSTAALCRHAEEAVGLPAARFDNGVGILLAQACDAALAQPRSPGPLRVGYLSGTDTHDEDWLQVEPAVLAVLEARPDVELWLGGLVTPSAAVAAFGDRVRRIPFLPWGQVPTVLRDLDVNLAPLDQARRFNEAKSAIKWLEAALTATPTVATPTLPYREAVRPGQNGMLATGTDEWVAAIGALLDDEGLRHRLGRRARRDALLRWSPHRQATRYLEILETEPRARRRPGAGWQPVLRDEPFTPVSLEAYQLGAGGRRREGWAELAPALSGLTHRLRVLAGRGRRSLHDHGPAGAARKALALGLRQWRRGRPSE